MDKSGREVTILITDEDYDKLQAYALLLKKKEQELCAGTEQEPGDYAVEDIVMMGIRDQLDIFGIMCEVG